jgi:hypothetical protein
MCGRVDLWSFTPDELLTIGQFIFESRVASVLYAWTAESTRASRRSPLSERRRNFTGPKRAPLPNAQRSVSDSARETTRWVEKKD